MQLDHKEVLDNLAILDYFDTNKLPSNLHIVKEGGGSDLVPVYFAANADNGDLYICVRGATDANDFKIVFDMETIPFANGYAHRGFITCARKICKDLDDLISKCNGTIRCMGHSLGAATTIALSSILRFEREMKNVFCYNFAQPPVLSQSVADKTRDFITSVILGADIVPKITTRNIGALINMMAPEGPNREAGLLSLKMMVEKTMIGIVAGQGVTDPAQLEAVKQQLSLDSIIKNATSGNYENSAVLSGKLYHIIPKGDGTANVIPYDEKQSFDMLSMMIGVNQHYIRFYIKALNDLWGQQGPKQDNELD